jgi:hypothetical protein
MRVRDWQDILDDVTDANAAAADWRAVAGDRANGIGEDMYLGHPQVGVFQLKTFAKNPFEVRGVGSQVARRIDDELAPLFPKRGDGGFGLQEPVTDEEEAAETAKRLETVLETHADAPTSPDALFEDVMEAMDSPAYGPMEYDQYDRPAAMDKLAETFEEAEQLLEAEFDDVVDEDVDRGFH